MTSLQRDPFKLIVSLLDDLTDDQRASLLRRLMPEDPNARIDIVALAWCRQVGASFDQVRGPTRFQSVVRWRHGLMRHLHAQGFSSVEIGRLLNRNHTTVLSAVKQGVRS